MGKHFLCDRWSKLDSLLSYLSSQANSPDPEMLSTECSSMLKKLADAYASDAKLQTKIKFIAEQVSLTTQGHPRYSTDTLIWSSLLYNSSPSNYRFMRESNTLNLPHPKYLQKIINKKVTLEPGLSQDQVNLMRERYRMITDREKLVNLLIDEIHVQPEVNYSGGVITGTSVNTDSEANALQVFMISSYFSSNKEVVAIYPVRSTTKDVLHDLTINVLKCLHNIGYKVLGIISDNNRINRNMFEHLCGGTLQSSIKHPFSDDPLFLLFDTVHILKSIRNNWLNQKFPSKEVMRFPSFDCCDAVHLAKLEDLKKIYD